MTQSSPAKTTTIIDTSDRLQTESFKAALKSRITPEIVVGFVGPIASGVTTACRILESQITERYGYVANYIRLSDLIAANGDRVGETGAIPSSPAHRIEKLQSIGTKLREKFGSGYLAAKVVEAIAIQRGVDGYTDDALTDPKARRVVHILDSIKNKEEVEVLRLAYGSAFWLVGVFAPKTLRVKRLTANNCPEGEAREVMERDEHEGPDHGQDVRKTFHESDYFIKNVSSAKAKLEPVIERLLQAIFEDEIITPTNDERGMVGAKEAAAASSCLSRQVGAVIFDANGSPIGTGWNEVPSAGGGTYSTASGEHDARCFKHQNKNCRNDERKERLYAEIYEKMKAILPVETDFATVAGILKKTGVSSLIEFSRSVHAEMAAIVDTARNGRGAVANSTMYVTTFPCHNCARHIIASGITRVLYIEPYPKSLATELHDDALQDGAVDDNPHAGRPMVMIEPYEGVGPNRYFSVFLARGERKAAGILVPKLPKQALPATPESLDAFTTREKRIVETLKMREDQAAPNDPQAA